MLEKEKKCIGIIFGGNSNEHYVSISSAKTVYKALISKANNERFRVQAFYINKHGVWFDNDQSLEILKEKSIKDKTDKYDLFPKEEINFLNNIEFNYSFGDELNVKITKVRSFSLSGQIFK